MRPHSTSKTLVSKYRIPELRKVLNTKNPFSRVYFGWKDKFVISKFQNGSLTPQGVNYEISLRQKGEMLKFYKVRKILGSSQVKR